MFEYYLQEHTSILKIFESTIKQNWERPAFTDFGTDLTFTYGDVASEIARLHDFFRAQGIQPRDRIAICDRNSCGWVVGFLAAFSYGAVAVPILHDFHGEQIRNVLVHSEAKLIICNKHVVERIVEHDASPVPCEVLDVATIRPGQYGKPLSADDVEFFTENPDDLCILSYTSGSTGYSKGVMIPYRAILSNTLFADEKLGIERNARLLSMLPLAHMYGFAFEFAYCFSIGVHVHFLTKAPSPSVLMEAFSAIRPRLVIAVPLIIEKIVRGSIFPVIRAARMRHLLRIPFVRNLIYTRIRKKLLALFGGNIYEIVIGGAAFNSEVEDFLQRIKFPYTVGYGMTECAPIITYSDWTTFAKGSCGRVAPRMEVKVLSPDPEHQPGELLARGTNVMLGYYKHPEATAETLEADGWLHTGDLATMDKNGNVYLRGRLKNMLLGANGQNIYPEEIEEKFTSYALFDECVVVQRDQKLTLLVYTSDDTLQKHGMTREEHSQKFDSYRRHVNSMLPAYAAVSAIEARETPFEKTPKQNIRRFLYQ